MRIVDEPTWPAEPGDPVVVLYETSSSFETSQIEAWVGRNRPAATEVTMIRLPGSRRASRAATLDPALGLRLAEDDDPVLLPMRMAWMAPHRGGKRSVRLIDMVRFGDVRDPDRFRQRWLATRHRELMRILAGNTARKSALAAGLDRERTLAGHVAHRAWLALETSERELRGARYKVSRFVHEEVLGRPEFEDQLLALGEDKPLPDLKRRASRYLREIAASQRTWAIDLFAGGVHWLYRQGYRRLDYDDQQFRDLYALAQEYPLVFLPSHKSNMDHLILTYLLWENELPPNHAAGGLNMNFFPVGPLLRRTGLFFIRRSFKDNDVYKLVLRSYLDFLVEKRFSLEWYLEGGRSRSGRLLPPRYGLLGYVMDSYRRGKADDIYLIPAAIAYDEIQDVGSYTEEQLGGAKQQESFSWMVKAIATLRRRYGSIHLRFGEPISMAKELVELEHDRLQTEKLAFEVMNRINRVTPITPTSLVASELLAADSALTRDEINERLLPIARYIQDRNLPTTEPVDGSRDAMVSSVLDRLVGHGVVESYQGPTSTVFSIKRGQELSAAYYRNTVVHHFLNGSIAEAAVAAVDELGQRDIEAFWEHVLALRDLLKFEFFFGDKRSFIDEVRTDLDARLPDWEDRLVAGNLSVGDLNPRLSSRTLLPILEGYRVFADALAADPEARDEKEVTKRSLALGKQYILQGRVLTHESISKSMFGGAWRLAENRQIIEDASARAVFAEEVETAVRWTSPS